AARARVRARALVRASGRSIVGRDAEGGIGGLPVARVAVLARRRPRDQRTGDAESAGVRGARGRRPDRGEGAARRTLALGVRAADLEAAPGPCRAVAALANGR